MINRFKLYHGDCMDILPTLEPGLIDSLVTDPPYGTASPTKVCKRGSELTPFDIDWDNTMPLDWLKWIDSILCLGGAGFIFTDLNKVSYLFSELENNALHPLQLFFWIKKNPPPNPRKNFRSAVETSVFFRKPGKINYWDGGGHTTNTFMTNLVSSSERTAHPTQKPISLMKHLIQLVTPSDGIVIDPFMGSGTTGVAAMQLGRRFIGIERDQTYFNTASQRIEDACYQLKLFT